MPITGLNHITLAVSDLPRALDFYRDVLGARQVTDAPGSVYLDLGGIWLCLERADHVTTRADDTHIALSCGKADFDALAARISARAALWKVNRSEGASLYFLDPDGHKLELHIGDLASRLVHYRSHPDKGVRVLKP
ncbi:VOC family protein [Hasllibacter sp. MH4015]|uniref:VOC family protein n=1 Tax=Hasllibacter sp. MH4015 TaxID=2854029 RepID=UPI001CD6D620|nr:VOC family protein [Hasllibacter sp. MH4015]